MTSLTEEEARVVMGNPKVIDNDRDEITVELGGKELRGWSYKDENERRVKMLCAREYVEGWCDGKETAPQINLALHTDLLALFEKLDQFDWLLNPDHMKAVADEIDCDYSRCENVWWESDTNASGCRLSESGGFCPNELAIMLRESALAVKRINEGRNSFGWLS